MTAASTPQRFLAWLARLPPWVWPAGAGLFAAIYALLYVGAFSSGFPPSGKAAGDYALLQSGAERLLQGDYPRNTVYPLPALLYGRLLSFAGAPGGFLLGALLSLASLVALTAWAAAQGRRVPAWAPGFGNGWLAILALLAAHYGLHWDFRAHNLNLVVLLLLWLALLDGERHPWRAGLWLAASGALKLYALVLLPWLLWRRQWRWLLATLMFLLLLFVVVPLLALGPQTAWDLTLDWLRQAMALGSAAAEAQFVATLATLRGLLAALLVLPLTDPALVLPLWLFRALLVAATAWTLWRLAHSGEAPRQRWLAEGAVLTLLPLAFSPVAQPHHAAAFLLPTLWLAARVPTAGRLGGGLLLALLFALAVAPYLSYLAPGTIHRGLMLHGGSLLLILAVGRAAGLGQGSVAAPQRTGQT